MYHREGINIFLDGFVPTENLRFREESLVFKVSENAAEEDVKRMARYLGHQCSNILKFNEFILVTHIPR